MLMRCRGVLVRVAAMFVRGCSMFFCFGVPPMVVMVRGLAVMVRGVFVMRRRFVVMFAGGMLCFGHDVSSHICRPLKGA
jgi:hypothetical protein